MLNDLKFELRQLLKSPGFTLTAVLTLALGIGANTGVWRCGRFAVGLFVAALLMRFLRSFLFGVRVLDPVTFCAVPAVMFLLALIAAWVPARRAAAVDPMETLRNE